MTTPILTVLIATGMMVAPHYAMAVDAVVNASAVHATDLSVERAARSYRIEVYDNLRTDREEFNARYQKSHKLIRLWNRSQQTDEEHAQVIQWFEDSRNASNSKTLTPLAALPDLSRALDPKISKLSHPTSDTLARGAETPKVEISTTILTGPATEAQAEQKKTSDADSNWTSNVFTSVGRAFWRASVAASSDDD